MRWHLNDVLCYSANVTERRTTIILTLTVVLWTLAVRVECKNTDHNVV